ncbi:pyruvate flavodoxin/ferredoxin oxidoreductase domain protein [Thermovirga lienii DSM 17291]|jgi:2-oxoglutarate ferredoxin oxidoreductase subunit alpha|uniref:Pyruvate flavodoxin/ferredoxin oxidoreductase domain protein n=1 Tax=Thermovirga lienii (strain ATCC BAA-1197 / DSM 17291 / Cas60314) TaxID=580340 RepID=G7V9Y9_THELD|nr:2-oxoacid:acceptor oxidoreductase subunit alpha [Thermovirga lienii]AER66689.1 pyruvate flavodoxin/ferredoxin oxidoreductase domain protein [Thermovirga lienii DSM 17291]KUK42535.1 MAG: Pyruvate flavodoxin/ferredoxin oxidoreductase domain protein [Thermovirga lienii]MDN5318509.1 2-oxoglutarate/2-oxoacid ferredoxin oxidoreductase subunit alpha [Thermovirga sp.]HCD71123.1 2-oxoacid:acceptor oxidoreductase subunit alpha [Thermovirga lienii]
MRKAEFWQGNVAVAHGAIAAGCRFFGGYPITPSSEIAEVMAEELPKVGGKFIQMEDEIGGIAAAIGGSIAGFKSMTATSGPGFSLKQENLGLAYMAEIPLVVVDVMRGGPSTGLPTAISQQDVMQARWGTHGDHATIAYSPASVQECYEITIKAFNMAERFRQPVLIMSDEVLGHMREKVFVPAKEEITLVDRKKPSVHPDEFMAYKPDPEDNIPPMASFGDGYRWHITGLTHNEWGFPTNDKDEIAKKSKRLMDKVEAYRDEIVEYDTEFVDDAEIIVVSYGSVARSALTAVKAAREEGMKVGYFRPITLWPFPDKELERLAEKASCIIVPELNYGQMVLEVERAVHGKAEVKPLNLVNGELFKPKDILQYAKEVA